MKIPKEIYRFIEFELYHYGQYKKELKLERERILECSGQPVDGLPKGTGVSNQPLNKTIQLNGSTAVLSIERRINAVDATLKRLGYTHQKLFHELYVKQRSDRYMMCDELGVSYETWKRYKQSIIFGVGNELGLIKIY